MDTTRNHQTASAILDRQSDDFQMHTSESAKGRSNSTQSQQAEEIKKYLAQVDSMSKMLDSKFKIPGTKIRFGYDSLLGLIPVVGDTLSLSISGYIVYIAWKVKARKRVIVRMIGNLIRDYIVGLVPLVGDLLDIANKANLRNARLLAQELERLHPAQTQA